MLLSASVPILLFALALTLPGLAPVRRAFAERHPPPALAPGETLLAEIRPASAMLATLCLALAGALLAVALALQLLAGARPIAALLPLGPFAVAALAWLGLEARARWLVTDRRVITRLGASLPLHEIARIRVGASSLRLDGRGAQSLRLIGLADARGAACLIRDALRR